MKSGTLAGVRINGSYIRRQYSTVAERRTVVQEFRQSGLTQKDFAAKRRMTLSTLTRWLRDNHLAKEAETQSAPVQFHSLAFPAGSAWAAEVQQPNGTLVRFQAGTPPELATAILRAGR